MNTESSLELKIAKVINGPWYDVPSTSKHSLTELRDVKWNILSDQEKGMYKQQAKAVIKYLLDKGVDHYDLYKD